MRRIITIIRFAALVSAFATVAKAHTVTLNLFDLSCPTMFDQNSQYWTTNFDLGVTFTEITNVYIN